MACLQRYFNNIYSLKMTLQRWKNRKTKLLSAAKEFQQKRDEKLRKQNSTSNRLAVDQNQTEIKIGNTEDDQQIPSTNPLKSDLLFDDDDGDDDGDDAQAINNNDNNDNNNNTYNLPTSDTPFDSTPLDNISSSPQFNSLLIVSSPPSSSPISSSPNLTNSDKYLLNQKDNQLKDISTPLSSSPSKAILATTSTILNEPVVQNNDNKEDILTSLDQIVNELRDEYQTVSDQTLEEFNRFMENKKRFVLESIVTYSTQQVILTFIF